MATKDFDAVLNILKDCYPNAKPMLEFNGTFELLVAVILSAQCTDKRVNIVSKTLFQKYNTPETFAMLSIYSSEPLFKVGSAILPKLQPFPTQSDAEMYPYISNAIL